MLLIKELSKDEIVLSVHGQLILKNEHHFADKLAELTEGPHKILIIDLSEAKSINSYCIARILIAAQRLALQNKTLQIRGCSEKLYDDFMMIRLDTVIDIKKEPP